MRVYYLRTKKTCTLQLLVTRHYHWSYMYGNNYVCITNARLHLCFQYCSSLVPRLFATCGKPGYEARTSRKYTERELAYAHGPSTQVEQWDLVSIRLCVITPTCTRGHQALLRLNTIVLGNEARETSLARLLPMALLLVLHTLGDKLVICPRITLYYGDTYIHVHVLCHSGVIL